MNRLILTLFSLATILFLFGGMVAAEEGSNSDSGSSSSGKNTDAMKAAKIANTQKMEHFKEFKEETESELEIRAMKLAESASMAMRTETRLKIRGTLPANLDDETREALARFNIDDATLARIRALSTSEQERAWEEIRVRFRQRGDRTEYELRLKNIEDHAKEVLDARKLDGDERSHERLRLALKLAERLDNAEFKERLEALRLKLANKTTLNNADMAEIDEEIWAQRMEDFSEKTPRVLEIAERINTRLTEFITRLENLIDEKNAAGQNTARLEAGLNKLNNLQDKLEEQLTETQASWDAFSADPSRDGLKTVHHDIVQLRVLARHAVHDMHVIVRWYKHFSDHDGEIEVEEADAYEDALVDEIELEAEVEVEAEEEADAVVGEAVETDDSGADSPSDTDDSDEDNGETDDSGMDSAEDIQENAEGGTV